MPITINGTPFMEIHRTLVSSKTQGSYAQRLASRKRSFHGPHRMSNGAKRKQPPPILPTHVWHRDVKERSLAMAARPSAWGQAIIKEVLHGS